MLESRVDIRRARSEELPWLLEVERRAGVRFESVSGLGEVTADLTPIAELEEAYREHRVWVAVIDNAEVVGFAYVALIDDYCHLEEVDVLPEYGRRGIGSALVRQVRDYATGKGLAGVTLTTYREVAWNAPFYRRLGFEVLSRETLTPGLAEAVADEARRGLPPEHRVVMVWRC